MLKQRRIIVALMFFAASAIASELPTGTLDGLGFLVEKGAQRMTERDLHAYSSTVTIRKVGDNAFEFTIVANLQRSPTTPLKVDRRVDIYSVTWDSPTSGKMSNRNPAFQDDKSTFTISDTELVIKSWISRNQLWETQRYRLGNRPRK